MTTQALKEELIAAAENDDSTEERLREALEAPEPHAKGEPVGTLIHATPDTVSPGGAPVVPGEGSSGSSAVGAFELNVEEGSGWRWAWNTRSYERSRFLTYMLAQKLSEKFTGSNQYVWTTRQPKDDQGNVLYPLRGDNLCILHENHPDRKYHVFLGLPTCRKANLTSPFQVRLHAQHRHSQEWGVLEEERSNAREDLDRRAQEATITLAKNSVAEQVEPTVTVNGSVDTTWSPVATEALAEDRPLGDCPHCEFVSGARKKITRKSSLAVHIKNKHGG
jgi:hypothetical protein